MRRAIVFMLIMLLSGTAVGQGITFYTTAQEDSLRLFPRTSGQREYRPPTEGEIVAWCDEVLAELRSGDASRVVEAAKRLDHKAMWTSLIGAMLRSYMPPGGNEASALGREVMGRELGPYLPLMVESPIDTLRVIAFRSAHRMNYCSEAMTEKAFACIDDSLPGVRVNVASYLSVCGAESIPRLLDMLPTMDAEQREVAFRTFGLLQLRWRESALLPESTMVDLSETLLAEFPTASDSEREKILKAFQYPGIALADIKDLLLELIWGEDRTWAVEAT